MKRRLPGNCKKFNGLTTKQWTDALQQILDKV